MKISNYKDLEVCLDQKNTSIVSFDVFDTLIRRDCSPDKLLKYISFRVRDLICAHGYEVLVDPLQARHESHADACSHLLADGDDRDLTLREWIPFWIGRLVGQDFGADHELNDKIYHLELECELAFLRPNLGMLELCQRLYAKGRRLVFCSDMYIGSEAIQCFLDKCGYAGLFERGYCSGNVRKLKRTGRLFAYVAEDMGVEYKDFHHVGDNEKADYRVPLSLGIESYWLVTKDQTTRLNKIVEDERKEALLPKYAGVSAFDYCLSRAGDFLSEEERIGFECFGAPLAVFSHKIIEYCSEHGISDVYFMAREGFLLKGIFERVLQDYEGAVLRPHYLAVSRHTSYLAATSHYGLRELTSAVANAPRVTLKTLFAPFEIPDSTLIDVGKRYGFQYLDVDLPSFYLDWPPLHKILQDPVIVEHIQTKSRKGRGLLEDYLTQEGVLGGGKIALVDVGWSGQIQDNIYQAFIGHDALPEIHGLYFGCRAKARQRSNLANRFVPLICDEIENQWHRNESLNFVFPWEVLTRAPHGTVVSYVNEGERVLPVFKDDSNPSRNIEVLDQPKISAYQRGIYRFICRYQSYWKVIKPHIPNLEDAFLLPFYGLSKYPSPSEASALGALRNISDLGSNDVYTLVDPNQKKIKGWQHSLWPGGQLTALNVSMSKRRRLYQKLALKCLRSKKFRDENWVNYPIDFGSIEPKARQAPLAIGVGESLFDRHLEDFDYRAGTESNIYQERRNYTDLIDWLPEDYALVKWINFRALIKKKALYEISGSLLRALKKNLK